MATTKKDSAVSPASAKPVDLTAQARWLLQNFGGNQTQFNSKRN